jgi:hypothetical protein
MALLRPRWRCAAELNGLGQQGNQPLQRILQSSSPLHFTDGAAAIFEKTKISNLVAWPVAEFRPMQIPIAGQPAG